ncbi:MAG: DUF3014 domain-containing protein [Thermoanaerobaculia bacterium]
MPEYDPPRSEPDIDLELEPSAELPPWLERRQRPRWPWGVALLVLIAAGVLAFLYWRARTAAPSAGDIAERPTEEPATVPAPTLEEAPAAPVPPLDASDDWARRQARALSDDPLMARAVSGEDLIRRAVVSVINAAEGVSPRRQFPGLAPDQPFAPDTQGGRAFLGVTSYGRYDRLASLVDSLDPEACAGAYRLARPLLDAAFREQGYPEQSFNGMLRRALSQVQATPTPTEPLALERAVRSWRFVDPELEALSPLQKQLLRMGPRNRDLIQSKLEAIVARLNPE